MPLVWWAMHCVSYHEVPVIPTPSTPQVRHTYGFLDFIRIEYP